MILIGPSKKILRICLPLSRMVCFLTRLYVTRILSYHNPLPLKSSLIGSSKYDDEDDGNEDEHDKVKKDNGENENDKHDKVKKGNGENEDDGHGKDKKDKCEKDKVEVDRNKNDDGAEVER